MNAINSITNEPFEHSTESYSLLTCIYRTLLMIYSSPMTRCFCCADVAFSEKSHISWKSCSFHITPTSYTIWIACEQYFQIPEKYVWSVMCTLIITSTATVFIAIFYFGIIHLYRIFRLFKEVYRRVCFQFIVLSFPSSFLSIVLWPSWV